MTNIPKDLSDAGLKAAEVILKIVGNVDGFISPSEWKERGEEHGLSAELIVVHSNAKLGPYFSMDYDNPTKYDHMADELQKIGMYSYVCTSGVSGIYLD